MQLKRFFSIKILLLSLSLITLLSFSAISGIGLISNYLLKDNMKTLVDITDVNQVFAELISNVDDAVENSLNIAVVRDLDTLNQLSRSSAYQQKIDGNVTIVREITQQEPVVAQHLKELLSNTSKLLSLNDQIFDAKQNFLTAQQDFEKVEQNLQETIKSFDQSTKSLSGKIRFSVKSEQRKIERLLKKIAAGNSEGSIAKVQQLLASELSDAGKQSVTLLETVLRLEIFSRQISTNDDSDLLTHLRDNLTKQNKTYNC